MFFKEFSDYYRLPNQRIFFLNYFSPLMYGKLIVFWSFLTTFLTDLDGLCLIREFTFLN